MQQISTPPSALSEEIVNENFETLEHQAVYGKAHATTNGLIWGYYGGRWGGFSVAAGTLTLTGSATNYVVVAVATGVISVSTTSTNWNDTTNYVRVYKLTTASGAVSAEEDHRAGPGGVHGGGGGSGGGGTVDLTTDVTGTLPVANGGTGRASHTAYAVLCGGTTSTGAQQSVASVGTSGQVLTSAGAGALPTWQTPASGGDASTNTATSVDGEVALFSGTGGKTLKRATGTGIARLASGVQSVSELSGDVTTSGSNATTIANGAVTSAKMANMAQNTLKGRYSSGTGVPEDLTYNQIRLLINKKQTLSDASTISWDADSGVNARVVLGGNRTLANPTNLADGDVLNLRIVQDATGSRTLSYGTKYKWAGGTAPVLTTTANAVDFLSCQYDASADTLVCVLSKDHK